MRKIIIGASALALMAGIATANAAAMNASGVISKIDTNGYTVTLSSGTPAEFWVAKTFKLGALKVGEKVNITYELQNGKPMASAIAANVISSVLPAFFMKFKPVKISM